jgi:sulfur carrier protein
VPQDWIRSRGMKIIVNGEAKEVPAGFKLDELLERFEMPRQRIAVELNKSVVRRAEWPSVSLNEGDRIEVVHFVGGG